MKIETYSPTIRRKEMDAVLTAMVEDKIGPGEQAKFLIQTARERIHFDYCLALRSPAIALFLALKSLNLEKGQKVIVSALSPLYYGRVIEDLGLAPVYCDVSSSTCCMSRDTVEKAIASGTGSADTRCIILHHTLGYVPDVAAIAELGIPIIEDCSQSYGTRLKSDTESDEENIKSPGEKTGDENPIIKKTSADTNTGEGSSAAKGIPLGNFGIFTILGLEERDMLTSGGGALLYSVNRRDAAVLRNLGDLPPEFGLPDMNAAMAVVQFREAAKNLLKRREIARLYGQSALRTRHKRFVQFDDLEYNNYAFPLILETGMKDVKAYARRKDIAVENAFENTLAGIGIVTSVQCPEAYSLSLRTALFPIYPRLGASDAGKVAKLILTLP